MRPHRLLRASGCRPDIWLGLWLGICNATAAAPAFDSAARPTDKALKILRITPAGDDVKAGRQVVFQFDRPVVPIGRMERDAAAIPISIAPALACEWRWLNTSALACQLREEHKMRLATRYRIEVAPGITATTGARLSEKITHTFTTARPKITYTRFFNWLSPGTPLIQVTFNQPVTKTSVEQALAIKTDASVRKARVPVLAFPDDLPRTQPWWATGSDLEQQRVNDRPTQLAGDSARKVWLVEPRQELPLDRAARLEVAPGLVSSEGSEAGIEQRTVVSFHTYPEFAVIGLRCTLRGQRRASDLLLGDLQPDRQDKRCAPLSAVALIFSAPVLNSSVKNHIRFKPALDGGRKDYDPWQNTHDWTRLTSAHRANRHYYVWLPELLQAHRQYAVNIDRQSFTDEFGRTLPAPADFTFFTSHREPGLRLRHRQAVLEKDIDSEVPLYVTNLDKVTVTYDRLDAAAAASGLVRELPVEKAQNIAYATPLGVRTLLGGNSGMIYGRLRPDPTPPDWREDTEILAQVTPYQVHAKMGHFNSLLWVTDFAAGQPVPAARVSLLKGSYQDLAGLEELGIEATTDGRGLATLPGLAQLDPELEFIYGGYRANQPGFFARVESEGEIAVIPINHHFAVRGGGVYSHLRKRRGHSHAWGTTAQGVYKLGDTIDFKLYLRDQSNTQWVAPPPAGYNLRVLDPQQKVVYEKKAISLNAFGAFDDTFKVPEQGAVGWYRFELAPVEQPANRWDRIAWEPMTVLVSDFTPSPFKVKAELNGERFATGEQVAVTSLATLHAGGPFAAAEIRLTARLRPKTFTSASPLARGFSFGAGEQRSSDQVTLLDVRGQLDDLGQHEDSFTLPETEIYYGTVAVEAAVKDERGKFVAAAASADYAGRTRFVGLKNTRWLYQQGKTANLQTLVVDAAGNPAPGIEVTVAISHRDYKAARVKGPGNAYITKNIMSWVEETRCRATSTKTAATCKFKPERAGYYQFVARITDTEGKTHSTTLHGWVTGRGAVVWDQSDDATLPLVPEQNAYTVGDTARYLIKNPFPGTRALVTVERYGVLDSWIETLDTSTPVIEVPIKPDYLPGFYLSVVALSPRVAKPLGPDRVDLGKPAFRMGYVQTRVSDPYKELAVSIKTDRTTYKPRDRVKATLRVKPKAGDNREPYEIAVAVVDEAVLALNRQGRSYYDPYAGFNRLDSLDVNNYSLLSRLVGRQKFEKKGANPGGDGGSGYGQLRSLFKFVSYWNPAIKPDKRGRASIEFEVPDNLTGWRILAFAVTPSDRMGLGDANFKVNRPTEIRPVMPNQVTEGDSFNAGFSVMNRTDKARTLSIDIRASGPLDTAAKATINRRVQVAPFKRVNVWLPVQTEGSGQLRFVARGGDRRDRDAVEHQVPVHPRRSLETATTYGTTTAARVSEEIQIPEGIYPDVGSISAVLSPTVIGTLDGAFDYLKDYPHLCWEQRLTKAVAAGAYIELATYLDDKVAWAEPGDDIRETLTAATNFQAPNGGMTYWVPSNRHVSPYLSAYTALAFNWLRRNNFEVPAQVEARLHTYLLRLLRRDELPSFYSQGMASSVRAVALAALAQSGKIGTADIQRYRRHLPEMNLFGKAHFLQAALQTEPLDKDIVSDTVNTLLGQASQSGGKFQFNEAWDDSYKYLLATPLRANCAILSSFLRPGIDADIAARIGDIPFKLVRSITQSRGARSHWENTQENMFCLNALIDYAKIYESTDPAMNIAVNLGATRLGEAIFTRPTDAPVTLTRPLSVHSPGEATTMTIDREGDGRLYYAARIAYDLQVDNAARINAGIEVRREYSVERDGEFVLLQGPTQKRPMQIRRGELVKVDLFVSVPTARHFVTLYDPVPGGLEPVNTDLATASGVDADKGSFQAAAGSWFFTVADWSYYGRYFWSFYHRELRHDSARFYADYLPAGNYALSYTAQAIATGEFSVMPLHAEEMYDPDIYGKGLPALLEVKDEVQQ
ncbi:large extracellular alpha-helical protein [Exilibacterium tricleocarpae]|uniref:Large extracellular alpha-helical protein n=1 Tax=Exilibacterium tricleocarpae TaxID=2591008 RepID=A0A545SND9_9GAMM|nr:alpha-2-macroglobulin family protein [Exilibacterium tricleocarpae]TQV66502.1 large extracellular alpha-helical protein [Exilibacterium tricleocarpae]